MSNRVDKFLSVFPNRKQLGLATVFVFMFLFLDTIITHLFITSPGVQEGNPFMDVVINEAGFVGILGVKIVALFLMYLLFRMLSNSRQKLVILWILVVMYLGVSVINVVAVALI